MFPQAPVPAYVPKKKSIETDESVSVEKAEEAKQDKVSDEAIASYVVKLEKVANDGACVSMCVFFSFTQCFFFFNYYLSLIFHLSLLYLGFPFQVRAVDFEKDDDTNFHIDCIDAISNLRARVYRIPEVFIVLNLFVEDIFFAFLHPKCYFIFIPLICSFSYI